MVERKREYSVFGERRKAWLETHSLKLVLYVGRNDDMGIEFSDPDIGEPVALALAAGRGKFFINMTSMTEEELDLVEKFFNDAIAEARPTIKNLDEQARRAWEDGRDLYVRSYKQDPVIHTRRGFILHSDREVRGTSDDEREQHPHNSRLQERPNAVAPLQKPGPVHEEDR